MCDSSLFGDLPNLELKFNSNEIFLLAPEAYLETIAGNCYFTIAESLEERNFADSATLKRIFLGQTFLKHFSLTLDY